MAQECIDSRPILRGHTGPARSLVLLSSLTNDSGIASL